MNNESTLLKKAINAIDQTAVVDLLQRAVRIPSITKNEATVTELFKSELAKVSPQQIETYLFEGDRPNLTARIKGAGNGNSLMLLGHTDTVHVEGWRDAWQGTEREDPFGAAIVDGAIWGRGSGDMKAGLVTIIMALKAIHQAGLRPKGDVVVVFVGDEESGESNSGYSLGMKAAAQRIASGEIPRTDFAIYTEPTQLKIFTAQMGFFTANLKIQGKSAYFGTPWLGTDALRAAHKLLSKLYAYTDQLWETAEHPLLGRPFNLVTGINGGGYIAVPDSCTLSIIRKILPHETVTEAKSQLDSLVQRFSINEGVQVTIDYTAPRDHSAGGNPAETDENHSGVQALKQAIYNVTADSDCIEGAPFWSEMSFLNDLNIPTVYCSPGDITNCHTFHEHVEVEQLLDGVEIFVRFIADFCGLESA